MVFAMVKVKRDVAESTTVEVVVEKVVSEKEKKKTNKKLKW